MSPWIQVTLDFDHRASPSPGAIHYRVHWSPSDDWSGWAENEDEAMRKVAMLRKRAEHSERPR